MLLAEEFLLLNLDDTSGKLLVGNDKLEPALRGALLAELALRERIGITPDSDGWSRRRRLTITSLHPTDDRELDRALDYLSTREGKPIKSLVSTTGHRRFGKGLRNRLLDRLAGAGVVTQEQSLILGLFPHRRWPALDPLPEEEIRQRLHSALVAGLTPTESTVALIGLLHATRRVTKTVVSETPREVKARAKGLAEGDWVARAITQAIQEASSATGAASV
ncbi:MAG TPA: GPP34 family phosphoprotein [Propionibacteriaceae bacterium]